MRLLFLLVFSPLCLAYCPSGHYKDDTFHKCVKCTPCHIIQIPCTKYKDAVCAPVNDSESHHFQKYRIHFFDDDTEDEDLDEEIHSKNFVNNYYDSYYSQGEKEHHKKVDKHTKTKNLDKHHHKKKHFEFDSREEFGNYNDDKFDSEENTFSEKPKHKKHYEFSKKHKKKSDNYLTPEEVEDEKLHFILEKENMKAKKKMIHHKKINADEKTLEQWLKESQKQLELRKDDFIKALKGESDQNQKPNRKVRLNSPVVETEVTDFYSKSIDTKPLKNKKHFDGANFKVLENLEESDEGLELTSSLYDEDNKVSTSTQKTPLQESESSEIIGQGETADEVIRDEMGKHLLMERPRFNVIPFVIEKELPEIDFDREKKPYFSKHHLGSSKKNPTWDDESSTENRMAEEIKHHDVVSLPFTAAETLVWDWQAVAVASAVASCLVFFLVVAIYFIVNARQWKKVNKTYNKEIEEMSTRIALMQPTFESGTGDSHTTSLYMENLIFPGKDEEKKGDQKV